MFIVYFSILIIAGFMEFSPLFNTDNCFKKIALLMIILGALSHLANKAPPLIEVGIALYLFVDLCSSLFYKTFDRRGKDAIN